MEPGVSSLRGMDWTILSFNRLKISFRIFFYFLDRYDPLVLSKISEISLPKKHDRTKTVQVCCTYLPWLCLFFVPPFWQFNRTETVQNDHEKIKLILYVCLYLSGKVWLYYYI